MKTMKFKNEKELIAEVLEAVKGELSKGISNIAIAYPYRGNERLCALDFEGEFLRVFEIEPKRTPKQDELWLCGSTERWLYSTGEQNEEGYWAFYASGTTSLTNYHFHHAREFYPLDNIKPACQQCGAGERTCECSEVTE